MRVTFWVLLCAIAVYYQECFGLNFIDLPGFGSDETLDNTATAEDSESGKPLIVSDKKEQTKAESIDDINNRRNKYDDVPLFTTEKPPVSKMKEILPSHLQSIETERPYPPIKSTTSADNEAISNYRRHWLLSAPPAKNGDSTMNSFADDKDENIKSKINMLVQQTLHDTEIRMKSVQKLKDKHRDEAPYRVGFILSMIKKSRDVLNELFNVAVKHRDEWKALEQLKIFELIVHTNVDTTNLVRQLVEIHIQNLNATAHGERLRRSRVKDAVLPGGAT